MAYTDEKITPDALALAEHLSFAGALRLEEAAMAALDAMAYFGSGADEMGAIASLLVVAKAEKARAHKIMEREGIPGLTKGDDQ